MSGFEVAGIVLGSIPLVISALEHYEDGIGVMKNMIQYECVFSDISISFAASVAIFYNSCYQLLNPLNLPDQKLSQLLVERKAETWSDKQLHQELKQRLGSNSKIYLSLIEKLNKRILLFCKKLKLDDQLKAPWIKKDGTIDEKARKKFFGNAWTRIKGGFDSNKYAGLLQSIDNDIAKIAQLTAGDAKLEPIRAEQLSRRRTKHWKSVRDQAESLFKSLNSRPSPCSCSFPHSAQLQLQPQHIASQEEEDFFAEQDMIRFTLLLTFDKGSCVHGHPPWEWRGLAIEASPPDDTIQLRGPKQVSKKDQQAPPSFAITPATGSSSQQTQKSPQTNDDEITDLCKLLLKQPQTEQCLGFFNDNPRKHMVYCKPHSQQFSDVSRLQDLISTNRLRISTVEKCTLALTLASAVLQLWDTPWLPMTWTSKDIVMLKTSTGLTVPSHFYVSQTFTGGATTTSASSRNRRFVKNEMVFALGVALLELSYCQPLLDLKVPEDLNEQGLEDSMTEVSIATRLADRIHEREMDNYAKAVLRCVRCNFDTFSCDFENADFRQNFYVGVVAPLMADWNAEGRAEAEEKWMRGEDEGRAEEEQKWTRGE